MTPGTPMTVSWDPPKQMPRNVETDKGPPVCEHCRRTEDWHGLYAACMPRETERHTVFKAR